MPCGAAPNQDVELDCQAMNGHHANVNSGFEPILESLGLRTASAVRQLDAESQQRLVLRAARECDPDRVRSFRARQTTIVELDKEMKDELIAIGLFFWLVFPLFALIDVVPRCRMRSAMNQNWHQWCEPSDPQIEQWVLVGSVRRVLKSLPRSAWRQSRAVSGELDRIDRHWEQYRQVLGNLDAAMRATDEQRLAERLAALEERIEQETDESTLLSLQRQVHAIQGQQETLQGLVLTRNRLQASLDECVETLQHLRSRLALQAAADSTRQLAAINDAATQLREINEGLASRQAAAQQVLRLRA
jgi:hypothetical protein